MFPDGVGGSLVRAFYQRNTNPATPTYAGETRLARVSDQAVHYDRVVDFDERITMIGGSGTAYVRGDFVGAMDVLTWTPYWTSTNLSLEPVTPVATGGVAMHELSTGLLKELSSSGTEVQSGTFGGRWGTQDALGLWFGVSSSWALSARVSLPIDEAATSFRFLGGVGTGQNSERSVNRYKTMQDAAVDVLQFYNPFSIAADREFGGSICQVAGSYFFATLPNQGLPDQVAPTLCDSVVIPNRQIIQRGRYHTHGMAGDRGLSPQDMVNANNNPGIAWHVAEPCRSIYRYVGPNGQVNPDGTIGELLPFKTATLPPLPGKLAPNCNSQ
jgi:hypothetical protein